jgi:hypothetical protein
MFHTIHGGSNFHPGIKRTYEAMNTSFPGHKIPIRVIADLISECPTCQKVRLGMDHTIPVEILHLKQPHYRAQIGVDTLTVTPTDKYGNNVLIVTVEHFSKFISLYACDDHSAINMAKAMFIHYCTYGRFENVLTDPGSDMMSSTIVLLQSFLGVNKKVSLVDHHPSNGVEPSNKNILSHLRVFVQDLRLKDQWSDPTTLALIAHAINSSVHSETGFAPMELKFGSNDLPFMTLPDNDIISASAPQVLQLLNSNLKTIRDISHNFQMDLVAKRQDPASARNKFQTGDFVLFLYSAEGEMLNKLDAKFLGPYKVLTHVKNDVQVRNLVTDAISIFHAERLKPFYGSYEQAYDAALRDQDQYLINHFLAYRGDPLVRSSVSFQILFADGTTHWKPWSKDLFDTVQYEQYCTSLPQLAPLVVLLRESKILIAQVNLTPITNINIGDPAYMDIRAIGAGWYEGLNLPNQDTSTYVVPIMFVSWHSDQHLKINCSIPSLRINWTGKNAVNHFFIKSWCSNSILTPHMTLLTLDFIREHHLINKLRLATT